MRILALGVGGAGGRIVNHLYRTDRRSSKVACVQALVVDIDPDSIGKLSDLPENAKIYFPALGIARPDEWDQSQTATIDIAEIAARAQTMATGETDAVILFLGLGGSMADDAPNIITTLRSTMTEPIFALVTLPCLSEGVRRSAKAADQIEMISPLVDGVILFDNETWHKKVKIAEKMRPASDQGLASRIGLKKKKEPAESPEERMQNLLNDVIVRRVSLILRAGEFRADGGLDLAEVVLDAGEVLNTMKGMGFITIGYAVEQVTSHPLDFLTKLRPGTGFFADEHQKKASRIIDLAKQAIYHEISAPCDITSAHKALILVAGPSHELSMKGFMTVRKWIDRSIAGLETRSGDYPVMSTRFVAIIVMLTGLENVPRIAELKEIRADARARSMDDALPSSPEDLAAGDSIQPSPRKEHRDEMIRLPADKSSLASRRSEEPAPERHPVAISGPSTETGDRIPSPRPIVRQETVKEAPEAKTGPVQRTDEPSDSIRKFLKSRPVHQKMPHGMTKQADMRGATEQERQKIEEELQRQRQMAIGGGQTREPVAADTSDKVRESPLSTGQSGRLTEVHVTDAGSPPAKHVLIRKQAAKTVIIHKKSGRSEGEAQQDGMDKAGSPVGKKVPPEDSSSAKSPEDPGNHELLDTWIRQVKDQKKTRSSDDDDGTLTIDDAPGAVARDDALVHTSIKRGKGRGEERDHVSGIKKIETVREIEPAGKKRNRIRDDEDISFVE